MNVSVHATVRSSSVTAEGAAASSAAASIGWESRSSAITACQLAPIDSSERLAAGAGASGSTVATAVTAGVSSASVASSAAAAAAAGAPAAPAAAASSATAGACAGATSAAPGKVVVTDTGGWPATCAVISTSGGPPRPAA